jgi:hypothetical protein
MDGCLRGSGNSRKAAPVFLCSNLRQTSMLQSNYMLYRMSIERKLNQLLT